ncbi:MAG TPA: cytochrome P450 [Jatrophihabitans sp.]|nr:cytochrome P450 [Jatrophihabitans sp.]
MVRPDEPTLEQLTDDPHPHWHRLRAAGPVVRVPALAGWVVLSHPIASAVLRDPARFTVDDPRFSTGQLFGPSMLSTDGAEHARFNGAFAPGLRSAPVREGFAGYVRAEVSRLLGRQHGTVELRSQLAGPLAVSVMRELLGLTGIAPDTLLAWYAEIVTGVDRISAGEPAGAAAVRAHAELSEQIAAAMADRRTDLGGTLTLTEAVANAGILLFGGIETTEAMIALAVWHLLRQPEQAAAVRRDPELIPAAIDESLRLEPAASRVDRYTTEPVSLAGTTIPAGELVIVSLSAANRDPAVFSDPDSFDITRPNVNRQLAFAAGPHYCLGAQLARLQTEAVLTELLGRDARVVEQESGPPRGLVFRKPARVTVRW